MAWEAITARLCRSSGALPEATNGENDPRVPVTESEQMVEAVREAGHEVWYMKALDEGHGFAKKDNRDLYRQAAVLFLEKHLAQESGGGPSDRE